MSVNYTSDSSSCNCSSCGETEFFPNDRALNHQKTDKTLLSAFKSKLIRVIIGIIIFLIAVFFNFTYLIYFGLLLFSYLVVGGGVIYKAVSNISKGQVFDENFLMTIATLGAFAIGEYPEAAAVMLFYQVGILFETAAVNKSKRSIEALMEIRPDYANLQTEKGYEKVSPEKVEPGDLILIKPGEKVPLDGKVIKGTSTVDTSILTGESFPTRLSEGDEVLSGYINNNGILTVSVTKEFSRSTVSRILDLVQNAASKKAPTEKFITKFARYYTPVVVGAALAIAIIPPLILPAAAFSEWIYRALVFLVISCPCALVISIPIGFVGGLGKASRNGILIKGSNYLEALNDIDTIVFDKTGTITEGIFEVREIKPGPGFSERQLLKLAAIAEMPSNHPIAQALKKAYRGLNFEEFEEGNYTSYDEIPGMGVKVKLQDGREILAGNEKLLETEDVSLINLNRDHNTLNNDTTESTVVHLVVDGNYAGYIKISDRLKETSKEAVKNLRKIGIKRFAILTGDTWGAARGFARQLGIDQVYARLLPEEKLSKLENIYIERKKDNKGSLKGKLLYVGDGINDAPVLARADVGVAMGGLGSDAAVESSDIVLMTDEPGKLVSAISIAKETRNIVWQNIGFSLGIKGIVLLLGAVGLATMWQAVIADVGVMFLAAINSFRLSFF